MRKEFTIYDGDCKVSYESSPETNQQVVDKIIEWCKEYNQGCWEGLAQSDDGNIYSPDLVGFIMDNILKFRYEE